jgi:hypothetical protein
MHPEADMSIVNAILSGIAVISVLFVPVLISYIKEKINKSDEQTTDEDIQIHIETDEEYGRRVSQILE